MDIRAPRNAFALKARSVAEDLGFVALADVSTALESAPPNTYRLVGGHMVSLLVHRWDFGQELLRDTADADLGITPLLTGDEGLLLGGLRALGYARDGSRLRRDVHDVGVSIPEALARGTTPAALIDLLLPAYTTRARNEATRGDVTTTEIRGLAEALKRTATVLELDLVRLNDSKLRAKIALPDEADALVIKAFAWDSRHDEKDAQDIWRCAEVAFAASVSPDRFATGDARDARAILQRDFSSDASTGADALAKFARLSSIERDRRHTRVAALLDVVLGSSD